MKKVIITTAMLLTLSLSAFTQNPPPPQLNIQYQPSIISRQGKDVIVSDINESGDITGWLEDDNATPQAFLYVRTGVWTLFEKGDSRIHTKGYGITAAKTVVGSRRPIDRGFQGMRWWQNPANQSGYNTAVLEIAPGDNDVRDYDMLGGVEFADNNYFFVGTATVMKRFPTNMSGQTEYKATKQGFIKGAGGYVWLPNPRWGNNVGGITISSSTSGRSKIYTYVCGSAINGDNHRLPAYWYFTGGDMLDATKWVGLSIYVEGNGHINSLDRFGPGTSHLMGVGYYGSATPNAWMYDLTANNNYRLNEFQVSDISEAMDCASILPSANLPYDYIAVGICNSMAVKWEIKTAEGVRSNKIVDLYSVINQRNVSGLRLTSAVAVNGKGQILCQGVYNQKKVGVILSPSNNN